MMNVCRIASAAGLMPVLLAASALFLPEAAHAAPSFKHVVIIIQENRTPDNLFGSNPKFEPGVDIVTQGINSSGHPVQFSPVPLANCYDPGHTHAAFEALLTQGASAPAVTEKTKSCMEPPNPLLTYVDNSTGTVQPYFDIAQQYGFANRMFQTNQGPSFPAHQFLFGGTSAPSADTPLFAAENMALPKQNAGCIAPGRQSVRLINAQGSENGEKPIYPCLDHPTLADVLEAATPALSWRYYAAAPGSIWIAPNAISHICQAKGQGTAAHCSGPIWTAHVVANNPYQVLTDISNCNLAAVSWVTPTGEASDHPEMNNGTGPSWVAQIVNSIGQQACPQGEQYWDDTAILITWDDWGGWYDHVKPFNIVGAPAWGAGYTYGFRVPLLVVSAYTPPGYVSNDIYDFGSLLYFAEQTFGLGFIGAGVDIHTSYADSHAAARGALSGFFSLATPRQFVTIPAPYSRAYFLNAPKSAVPADRD